MSRRILRLGSFWGRASRREFGWIIVATLGLSLAHLVVIGNWPGIIHQPVIKFGSWGITALLTWVELAVSVRRMHDLNKSGWFLVLCIVPIVGVIISIWSFCRLGTPGQNRFGMATRPVNELTA